jgi:hypothetical protein
MSALLDKEFVVSAKHLSDEQLAMLSQQVKELDPDLDVAVKEDMNAQTLKAQVKRIRAEGKLQLPEAIKVTPIKQAKAFAK